jgi:hypothetical protein
MFDSSIAATLELIDLFRPTCKYRVSSLQANAGVEAGEQRHLLTRFLTRGYAG